LVPLINSDYSTLEVYTLILFSAIFSFNGHC